MEFAEVRLLVTCSQGEMNRRLDKGNGKGKHSEAVTM